MSQIEVETGSLSTGLKWHLVLSAKPDSNLIEGRHLILEGVDQQSPNEISPDELGELRLLAFRLAEKFASEPGHWRLDFNGPAISTQKHFHAHIKLPKGKDKLARLVG